MFGAFAQFARDRHTEGASDERPALWSPRDGKATADRARPIFHRMQPDPVAIAVIFGEANAIVPDAQPSPAAAAFKADIDLIGPTMADRVVHGFLCYPHQVRFRFAAQLGPAAVACKRAGDAISVADIARQSLEGAAETSAVQADWAETMGEVASSPMVSFRSRTISSAAAAGPSSASAARFLESTEAGAAMPARD